MAKEVDLKKLELKVFVHCCDGCKKKVKKVLRNIEGVFKTEIDPLDPKVTIFGNVEPQTLIKKLLKAGKQAKIWSYENQNAVKENTEIKSPTIEKEKEENENSKSSCEQTKHTETRATNTDKLIESPINMEGGGNKASNKNTNCLANTSASPGLMKIGNFISQPEANCIIHTSHAHDTSKVETEKNMQYCYIVEPHPIVLPYCAIYPYKGPPLTPTNTCSQELYDNGRIIWNPPFQAPVTRVGDYFSDENTVGCQVM